MKHSATHLFGLPKPMDAFDGGRTWNARLRDGGMKATDFNQNGVDSNCQSDIEHFVEENSAWNHYSMISVIYLHNGQNELELDEFLTVIIAGEIVRAEPRMVS
jgi:environmental stress-induced protein Ves